MSSINPSGAQPSSPLFPLGGSHLTTQGNNPVPVYILPDGIPDALYDIYSKLSNAQQWGQPPADVKTIVQNQKNRIDDILSKHPDPDLPSDFRWTLQMTSDNLKTYLNSGGDLTPISYAKNYLSLILNPMDTVTSNLWFYSDISDLKSWVTGGPGAWKNIRSITARLQNNITIALQNLPLDSPVRSDLDLFSKYLTAISQESNTKDTVRMKSQIEQLQPILDNVLKELQLHRAP